MADKITPKVLTSGFASIAPLNENFSDIATELNDKVLYRDTSEPNQMEIDFDMNSNRILNLSAPQNVNEAARLQDVLDGVTTTATVLPAPTSSAGKFLGASGSNFVFQDTSNLDWIQSGTGAITRNVEDKLRDTDIAFEDFGAVLDGSTDDSAAVAKAITVAAAEKRRLILTGNLFSPTKLIIPAGISIKGQRGSLNASIGATGFITDQDIILMEVTGRFTNLEDFAIRQIGSKLTSKGLNYLDNVTAFNRQTRVVVEGFDIGVFGERTLFQSHEDCNYENNNIGVDLIGAAGAWNSVWFNNVFHFRNVRFVNNTNIGARVKGVAINFDTCNAERSLVGFDVFGDNTSRRAFSTIFTGCYTEQCNNPYKFKFATATIIGGFSQGEITPVAGDHVIEADESTIFVKGKIDGQDSWDTFAKLTNNSNIIFDDEDTFGVAGAFTPNRFTFDTTSKVKFMTQQFKGQTASLAASAFEDIFTPNTLDSYMITINGDTFNNHYLSGIILKPGNGVVLQIVTLQSNRISITDAGAGGPIRITNISGADNQKYDWTLTKI